jgi:hypothetical protein
MFLHKRTEYSTLLFPHLHIVFVRLMVISKNMKYSMYQEAVTLMLLGMSEFLSLLSNTRCGKYDFPHHIFGCICLKRVKVMKREDIRCGINSAILKIQSLHRIIFQNCKVNRSKMRGFTQRNSTLYARKHQWVKWNGEIERNKVKHGHKISNGLGIEPVLVEE